MKILFITSAHNSLSQRVYLELTQRGHQIDIVLATSDQAMLRAVAVHAPDLIVAPMLKTAIPEEIWNRHVCLIVHPGIVGDRGPSSLDWALATGKSEWGVTVLQAVREMDAGPIWATKTFPIRRHASKSSLYHNEVTEAAVAGVLEAVAKLDDPDFKPMPLNYSDPAVKGTLLPMMRQSERQIDWRNDTSIAIAAKIRAADSSPGVLTTLCGTDVYLYGAHIEGCQRGCPGEILAHRDEALLIGTQDGALWITHMKSTTGPMAGIKLPARQVLRDKLEHVPEAPLAFDAVHAQPTFREIVYKEHNQIGYLTFEFYNGAMSTEQCRRLCEAYLQARFRPTKALVLMGGYDYFSNGIHLNTIEAADDPAAESWANINAIDDFVLEVIGTQSQLTIAALRGNAGAGGFMMALAADHVFARNGVVVNPHYKGMGGLYGSEYWTYLLPRRVGPVRAQQLTDGCRPLGVEEAVAMGLIDDAFGDTVEAFEAELRQRCEALINRPDWWQALLKKHQCRREDERSKPLAEYRAEELQHMWTNFFGSDPSYHQARQRFVFKGKNKPLANAQCPADRKLNSPAWRQRLSRLIKWGQSAG